jgi:hypothetical protein
MKLEFLDDLSCGGKYPDVITDQLIRLFDYTVEEVNAFSETITNVLIKNQHSIEVDKLAFVQPINCTLKFELYHENIGIVQNNSFDFSCQLTTDSFKDMISLLEPFTTDESSGYQWLCDSKTGIDLLFSEGGGW